MLLHHSIFETASFITSSFMILLIIVQYLTEVSPITSIWLLLCISAVFTLSVFISFRVVQKLLRLNKPIKYELDELLNGQLKFLKRVLPEVSLYPPTQNIVEKEYDTNELSVISTVLERKLVSSWYVPHVSQEIGFPFACKELLDQVIGKAFQITNKIDTPVLYTDICSITLSHFNEYKRAVKLLERSNEGTIETHFRMMHPTSNKKTSTEHCTNILRVIMKELVPWELWDTPHSELLIRILSKKLDSFIVNTLADPNWLNYKLVNILNPKDIHKSCASKSETEKESEVTETQALDQNEAKEELITKLLEPPKNTIESSLSSLITSTTAPILQNAITDQLKDETDTTDEKIEVQPIMEVQLSPVLRQRRGRQGRNEVKIYDRIIEGSVKTWDTDVDLRCVSLGQDLLASLDGEISLSRLWESDNTEIIDGWSPNPPSKSPQALWFGEEDAMELDLEGSPPKRQFSNVRTEQPSNNFILPQNIKDLQSTVSQAKHKIGDLQDEAAGMMEGILDFGIAGLKKGLRLTGLHEGQQDRTSTSPMKERSWNGRGTSPEATENGLKRKNAQNLLHNDSEEPAAPVVSNASLVKQHRVISQDSVPQPIPGKTPEPVKPESDSPEPEYEEAADFASSIAKLRSLLQQRTNDNTPPKWQDGSVWWDSAEETRGRTNESQRNNRPVDTATLADEYDLSADRSPVPGQSTNNMQRLDKLFQRTVTGVFNSIKTAVGAEGLGSEDGGLGAPGLTPPEHWAYVCTSIDVSVGGAVARLVGSRRAYTAVDAAQDSLEHLTPPQRITEAPAPLDLEEWCAGPGCCWSGTAEVMVGVGLWQSHVAHRAATLLIADVAESVIRAWLCELTTWLRKQIFVMFEEMAEEGEDNVQQPVETLDVDRLCGAIMDKIPGPLWLFGEETLRNVVKLTVNSFSNPKVNCDFSYRLLDLFALHFTQSAGASFDVL